MSIASSLRTGPFIEDEESFESAKYKDSLKAKCSKSLKKKLKKYKLRKNGQEDPEVLNVSESFDLSLKLRSPTQSPAVDANDNIDCDEFTYPKNYIIKMVRRKQTTLSKLFEKETKIEVSSESQISKKESDESRILSMKQKQTNAFKLLMDSRNKSIGSNSPGKERDNVEPESEELILKKTIKAKRHLALQKLAETKGSLKKIEIEKTQEECIRRKMNKRAERLKNMITSGDKNQSRKIIYSTVVYDIDENSSEIDKNCISENIHNNKPEILKENIGRREQNEKNNFVELDTNLISPKNKQNCKDDEEFLNKLSPSLKKKENMLCYFKKIDKQPDSIILSDQDIEKDELPIKVKINAKSKKKLKKKRHSLSKLNEIVVVDGIQTNEEQFEISNSSKEIVTIDNSTVVEEVTRKRKRHEIDKNCKINKDSPNNSSINEGRPKRNIKKPVKYDDDIQLSSSDEDLHIFTPKKKKNMGSTEKCIELNPNVIKSIKDENTAKHDKNSKKLTSNKLSSKIAPIFAGKSQVDVAAMEAKQKFLHSGMPEQLKKVIAHQKAQAIMADAFNPVVHIQQNDQTPRAILNHHLFDKSKIELDHDRNNIIEMFTKKMICLEDKEPKLQLAEPIIPFKQDIHSILHHIKENYPEFPVYRTYKTLFSKSKGGNKDFNSIDINESSEVLNCTVDPRNDDPDFLNWTDKYKATSSKHIIGNFDSHGELKKWLISCTEKYANPQKCYEDSDSDFYNSDTDSRENMRFTNNLLVLTGPPGSGKTAGVYAIATELSIKVIEVNVSSRRTGKILLQDLQEATQSHKVNRAKGSGSENSQNSQELIPSQGTKSLSKKHLKNKLKNATKLIVSSQKNNLLSQNSQEAGRTELSLILIDDADIVFEQDDGFITGIAQLVQCSKIPVILVTSSLLSPHLQKFLLCGNIIKMNPLSPRMLGTWLDIMCLADTGMCWPGTGAKFLDFYKGDMRKTINSLQFYAFSETQKICVVSNSEEVKETNLIGLDEENSSISWAGEGFSEGKNEASAKCNSLVPAGIWNHFIRNSCDKIYMTYPVDLFNIWWGLPNMLVNCYNGKEENTKQSRNDLEDLSNIMDSISFADCMNFKIKPGSRNDVSSDPWHCPESDSVTEQERLDDVNNFSEISHISQELVINNIKKFQEQHNFQDCEYHFPGLLEQRKRDKILSRHDALSNAVHWNSMLDRRALALDYWPACRSICRIEKDRTDSNSKRNNRFFHYLKSAKVLCKYDVFQKLCDSLKPSSESD